MRDVWRKHARQWHHVGAPLRPDAEDVRLLEQRVQAWSEQAACAAPRALLLGVTPEIACMRWPAATELLAVDRSAAMIAEVWPGDTCARHALCADWLQLPLPPAACHVVVGDGAFNALPDVAAQVHFAQVLAAQLAPHGRALVRAFVRPPRCESPAAVLAAVNAGAIANFHVFKFRLAMALADDAARSVRLGDVWQAWRDGVAEPAALARRMRWSQQTVATIDAYRELDARFSFPTADELCDTLATAFAVVARHVGRYEFAERCPTFELAARAP